MPLRVVNDFQSGKLRSKYMKIYILDKEGNKISEEIKKNIHQDEEKLDRLRKEKFDKFFSTPGIS